MSDIPAPKSHTPRHLLTKFQSALWTILENGIDVPDGNGGTARVTAPAKFFEVAAAHLKDNDITVKNETDISAMLQQLAAQQQPSLTQPVPSDDWTPTQHELQRPGDSATPVQ